MAAPHSGASRDRSGGRPRTDPVRQAPRENREGMALKESPVPLSSPDVRGRGLSRPELSGPELSVVVPVLDEEDAVGPFLAALRPVLDAAVESWEVIFVDDGSTDATAVRVRAAALGDGRVRLLELSRNFGKEAALTAGLEWASGRAVVPMDVDGQDPPELIAEFVRLWRQGFDVVVAQRACRGRDSRAKRSSAAAFYRLFNRIADHPIDPLAGDFRLMDRAALDATLRLRERSRFMKGLFAWVGFRTAAVPYERPARAAGRSKFDYWKLWNFALDGITSFSTAPLRVWTWVGLAVAAGAFAYGGLIVARTLIWGRDVPGYASLMVVMLMLGAVQLISLGVIGEYLGRLYTEAKQRPLYLVRDAAGFAGARSVGARPGGARSAGMGHWGDPADAVPAPRGLRLASIAAE